MEFSKRPNTAWPHQANEKGVLRACKNFSRNYHRSVCSAGGISSNITDMAAFLQLQLGEKPDILNAQDLLPFHTPVVEAPDAINWFKSDIKGKFKSYYGLGWRVLETEQGKIVFHGGYLKGFKNFMAFSPGHHIGIVILNNSESPFSKKIGMAFLGDVI